MSGERLALTPARRTRLEDVDAGHVYADEAGVWHKPSGRKVTTEIGHLVRAGWVEAAPHPLLPHCQVFRLTAEGREVLADLPAGPIAEKSVWRDLLRKGRRLRVIHAGRRTVEVAWTYSTAPDPWEHASNEVIPRREWTTRRYQLESTPDGAK
jgi:hypothetical protein